MFALITVRIWFRKEKNARFISHLDLNRCMTRALRRAKLPVWHTEGFNPHPFLTFALPLSLGVTGLQESMDIKMEQTMEAGELVDRLNAVLPEGITVTGAAPAQQKPGTIAAADYEIVFLDLSVSTMEAKEKINAFLQQGVIPAQKKNKKGEWRQLDLKPFLQTANLRVEDGFPILALRLPAGSGENVNPALVAQSLLDYAGFTARTETVRLRVLTGTGEVFR